MRYIGSKALSLPFLEQLVRRHAPTASSLCDPFAGTCSVSRHFKTRGFAVTTGDLLASSHAIQIATVGLNRLPLFKALRASNELRKAEAISSTGVMDHLNNLKGTHGYITETYSPAGPAKRRFFTERNAEKIDAARKTIHRWSSLALLSKNEEAFLLATLVTAADKVANTAGTYYAYLKSFSRRASNPIIFSPNQVQNNRRENRCNRAEAQKVAAGSDADILYLDPPYNERDYSSYYHLPETIVLGDKPKTHGASGVPLARRTIKSDFCVTTLASGAFEKIVASSRSKLIVMHYTPDGIIPHEFILHTLRAAGVTTFNDLKVRRYSTNPGSGAAFATHRIYLCQKH